MSRLGIDLSQWRNVIDEIEEHGCVALLKSKSYISPTNIAYHFAKDGLSSNDVHMLVNADSSTDAKAFFYWFTVDVRNGSHEVVMEHDYGDDGRYKTISPVEWMGIKGFLDAGNLLNAVDQAFPDQQNTFLNFAPEKIDSSTGIPSGKILGQVNSIFEDTESDGTYCVMTLAPYKNGTRFSDCSLDDSKNSPLRMPEVKKILSKMNPSRIVRVRYVDPLAFGPKAGQIIEVGIDHIEIDKRYGIFLRPSEDAKPKVIG